MTTASVAEAPGRSADDAAARPAKGPIAGRAGTTAIEYAIIAAGLSIVIIGGVAVIGGSVTGLFETVANAVAGG